LQKRINITYSVNLDDLEKETKRLYKSIVDDLEKTIGSAPMPKDFLSVKTLNSIASLQGNLVTLSERLLDLHTIVSGHIQYFASPPQDSVDSADQLLSPLEQVKQQLENLEALSDEIPS
jgi:hypothetical protein